MLKTCNNESNEDVIDKCTSGRGTETRRGARHVASRSLGGVGARPRGRGVTHFPMCR